MGSDHLITTIEDLEKVYGGDVYPPAKAKETDRITLAYRKLIEASPFFALASNGPGGLDCSPRGDPAGFVRVADEKTLLVPDRRGNNRIDTLRNLVHDPRVALLFLIPGCSETLRVMGRAAISVDPALTQQFVMEGKAPRSVLVVAVEAVFFQCAKAIVRSKLWDASRHVDRKTLADRGHDPCRDHRRRTRRSRARPRRARADEGDDLLSKEKRGPRPGGSATRAVKSGRTEWAMRPAFKEKVMRRATACRGRAPRRRPGSGRAAACQFERHHIGAAVRRADVEARKDRHRCDRRRPRGPLHPGATR